jgi:hypothetical protein
LISTGKIHGKKLITSPTIKGSNFVEELQRRSKRSIKSRAFQICMRFKFDAKHFFLTLLGSCRYYEGQLADLTELEDDGPEPKDSKKLLTEAATEVCLLILVGGLAWN